MVEYDCWLSHTCWVCRNTGEGLPRMHVSSKRYHPSSSCDTTVTVIEAETRQEAVIKFKKSRLYNKFMEN